MTDNSTNSANEETSGNVYEFVNDTKVDEDTKVDYSRPIILYSMDSPEGSDLPPLSPTQQKTYSDNAETTEIDSIAAQSSGYTTAEEFALIIGTNSGNYTLNGDAVYLNGFPVVDKLTESTTKITIENADVESYLESFNFVRYIAANPTSTVATNFNNVVKNSDASNLVSNVTAFCSNLSAFSKVTGSSWRQMTLWQTRDFSPWVGTYYVYPQGSPSSNAEIPSLLAKIVISLDSESHQPTAKLTMDSTNESVDLMFSWESAPSSDSNDDDDDDNQQVYIVNTNFGTGTDPVEVQIQPTWTTLEISGKYQTVGCFGGTVAGQEVFASPNQFSTDNGGGSSSSSSSFSDYQTYGIVSSSVSQFISLAMLGIMVKDSIRASKQSKTESAKTMEDMDKKIDDYQTQVEDYKENNQKLLDQLDEDQKVEFQESIDKSSKRLDNVIEAQGHTDDNTKEAANSIEKAEESLNNDDPPETIMGYVDEMNEKVTYSENVAFEDNIPESQQELAQQTQENIDNAEEIQQTQERQEKIDEENNKEDPDPNEIAEDFDIEPSVDGE